MWYLLLFFIVPAVFGASLLPCPESCQCQYLDSSMDLTCENFDFLNKLVPKQQSAITSLRINGAQLDLVSAKLKYLKNLQVLDLSGNNVLLSNLPALNKLKTLIVKDNNLKDFRFKSLPKNIEHLDLSSNYLAEIPRDWSVLRQLKTVNLTRNPVGCDCLNVLQYQEMRRNKIEFSGSVVCGNPKEFRGKSIEAVECSPLDLMLGDEGSGAGEEEAVVHGLSVPIMEEETDAKASNEVVDELEGSGEVATTQSTNQLIPIMTDENLIVDEAPVVQSEDVEALEGSGEEFIATTTAAPEDEEGSGFGIHIPQIEEAEEEVENETETVPVLGNLPEMPKACTDNCTENEGLVDEDDASPLPGIKEQFDILNGDLFNHNHEEHQDKTTQTPVVEEVEKKVLLKEQAEQDQDKGDKENYTLTENTKLGRASIGSEEGSDNTIYIIIGVISLAIVCSVILFIKKKNRSNNRRKQIPQENFGEELKPLDKKPVQPLNQKIPLNPDHVPLMNGNGKITPEENELDFKEVELRPNNTDLLTPKRERVTIKETEIPDSIPKTPLLVHREVSSDGKIVLTPVDNQ